jgi:hypothetical protein
MARARFPIDESEGAQRRDRFVETIVGKCGAMHIYHVASGTPVVTIPSMGFSPAPCPAMDGPMGSDLHRIRRFPRIERPRRTATCLFRKR